MEVPPSSPSRPRGPQPAATRAQVRAAARAILMTGELPEMAPLAERTGAGRTSLYRWFGSRDALVGELLAEYVSETIADGWARSSARGGARVAAATEHLLTDAGTRPAFVALLRRHPRQILGIVSDPDGAVLRASVDGVQALLDRAGDDGFVPIVNSRTLAFVLVQVGQAHMWARAAAGRPPDIDSAISATRELLGARRSS